MPTMPRPDRVKAPGKTHQVANPQATPRLRGRKLQSRNARLYRRDPLCGPCLADGKITEAVEWDHVVPLSLGGREHESNLQGLCPRHHDAKSIAEDAVRRAARGGRS